MNTDAVIGCDAIETSAQWLRLRITSGVVRTIPWSSIKFAGYGDNFAGSLTIGHLTDKVAPLFPTHDSLWIAYGDHGLVQAMMEGAAATREAILASFAQQLGTRWRGDRIAAFELQRQFMNETASAMASGIKKSLLIFGIVLILFIALMVWSEVKK